MTAGEAIEETAKRLSRQFSRWEIGVDGAIHAAAIVAGIVGSVILLVEAAAGGVAADVVVVSIYSAGLLAMFACSAAYNLGRFTRHGGWLRNLDQGAIFLMIAGTYTPFTVLHLSGFWSVAFTTVIWAAAGLGIILRLLLGRLFDRVSLVLYLTLGWMALLLVAPLLDSLGVAALLLLATGGALYTIGVVFHLWARLPFQAAIWHLFVVAAATTHFIAIALSIGAHA
jgi:hemolysin III